MKEDTSLTRTKSDSPLSAVNFLWEGRPLGGLFRSVSLIQLTPQALVTRGPFGRGTLWIPLKRIVNVTVDQNRLGRWLGVGSLRLIFRGSRSMTFWGIPDPFEGWKRLKIARFRLQRSP